MRASLALLLLACPTGAQTPLWELAGFGLAPGEMQYAEVARAQDFAVLGAYTANAIEGRAFVVEPSSGALLHELAKPNPGPLDQFGFAVAAHGERVLVSAPRDDQVGTLNAGAVYLYEAASGQLLHTFWPSTPEVFGGFGYGLDMCEEWIAIGEVKDPTYGAIHIYDAQTFAHVVTVHPPDQQAAQVFGGQVAVSSTGVMGAAVGEQVPFQGKGAAYLFDLPSGQLRHKFVDGSTTSMPAFGQDLALTDQYALIGSPENNTMGTKGGRAALYDAQSGALLHDLFAPIAAPFTYFGWSVALEGELALIGAPGTDLGGAGGAAHLYDASSGSLLHTYEAPSTLSGEQAYLGWECDLQDGKAIFTAHEQHIENPVGFVWVTEPVLVPPKLEDFVATLPASGATYWLALESAPSAAGDAYLVIGSMSGSSPGLALSPYAFLPLNPDVYTSISLAGAGSAPFFGTFGLLDADGYASFKIEVPPIPYAPVTVHHAALTLRFDAQGELALATSAPVVVDILP